MLNLKKGLSYILYAPWVLILVAIPILTYWAFEKTPLVITYAAPYFIKSPAHSRNEAKTLEILETPGGSIVYRYLEYCVNKPFSAHVQRSWVGSAIVWPAPDTMTSKSLETGCTYNSFALEVPTSSPTRTFNYTQRMHIIVNPIRTDIVDYPPIPLKILSPQDAAKK